MNRKFQVSYFSDSLYLTFAENIERQLSNEKILLLDGELYLIRDEDKHAFLLNKRQETINEIKKTNLFAWLPKDSKCYDYNDSKESLEATKKLLILYAKANSQVIKLKFKNGLMNADLRYKECFECLYNNPRFGGKRMFNFKFQDSNLVEFINNKCLLNFIDDRLKKMEMEDNKSNERKGNLPINKLIKDKNNWIDIFESLNVNEPPPLDIIIYQGEIGKDYVRNNYNPLIQTMYELKRNTCYLDDSAKLIYINKLKVHPPQMPNFDNFVMNQAFYQCDMYSYEFINEYKEYLLQKNKTLNELINAPKEIFYKEEKDKLIKFHNEFNDELWNYIDLEKFILTFRTNTRSEIKFKTGKRTYFHYALSLIENKRNKKIVPVFEDWIKVTFGGTHKNQKNPSDTNLKSRIVGCFR